MEKKRKTQPSKFTKSMSKWEIANVGRIACVPSSFIDLSMNVCAQWIINWKPVNFKSNKKGKLCVTLCVWMSCFFFGCNIKRESEIFLGWTATWEEKTPRKSLKKSICHFFWCVKFCFNQHFVLQKKNQILVEHNSFIGHCMQFIRAQTSIKWIWCGRKYTNEGDALQTNNKRNN